MTKLNDKIKLIEFTTRFVDPQPTLAIFSIDYIIYRYLTIAIRKMYHGRAKRLSNRNSRDRSANTDGPQVSDRLILRKLKLQRCRCAFRRTTCAAVKSANDGPFLPPLRVILVDWRGAIIRPRYRPRGSTARMGVLNDRYFFSLEKRPPRFVACLSCRASYLALIVPVATFSLCAATFMHR